jgi:hypothetical protein
MAGISSARELMAIKTGNRAESTVSPRMSLEFSNGEWWLSAIPWLTKAKVSQEIIRTKQRETQKAQPQLCASGLLTGDIGRQSSWRVLSKGA